MFQAKHLLIVVFPIYFLFVSPGSLAQQTVSGSGNIQIHGNDNEVSMERKQRKATVLNNQGSSTLVLKTYPSDGDFISHSMKTSNRLGLAEVGAEIEIIDERPTAFPLMNVSRIKILSGRLMGRTGWVSSGAVTIMQLGHE